LVAAIIVAEPHEHSEVFIEGLLEIEYEAGLEAVLAGLRNIEVRGRQCPGIAAHQGSVHEPKNAEPAGPGGYLVALFDFRLVAAALENQCIEVAGA
jgi:hypothetical protein